MAAKSSKTAKKKVPARKPAPKKKNAAAVKKAVKPVKPVRAKVPAKKAVAKKPAAKKPAAPARKARPVVKAKPVIAAVKKAPVERASSSKPIIRTGPSRPPTSFGKSPFGPLGRGPQPAPKATKEKPLTKTEIGFFKDLLLKLRDRVIDEISFLANDNLNRSAKDSSGDLSSYSFHMADQGTDNFDREFAASLLNNEHDVLYEIEEALRRIEQGTYGICEMSEKPIERERLKVIPFARYCVAVQSEMERGKPRFRPFRRTSIQTAESSTT